MQPVGQVAVHNRSLLYRQTVATSHGTAKTTEPGSPTPQGNRGRESASPRPAHPHLPAPWSSPSRQTWHLESTHGKKER